MEQVEDFLEEHQTGWLQALPSYQERTIKSFLEKGLSPEDAAETWLSSPGPSHTFPLGTGKSESVFLDKLYEEIEAFLCGADRYEEERREFLKSFEARHAYFVGGISAAVAPVLGAAAPLIAPPIALILVTVSRIGLNAWCQARQEMRTEAAME